AHALDLVRGTRPNRQVIGAHVASGSDGGPPAPEIIQRLVHWGAGPRAVQFMILAAKARAVLHGNYHVSTDDVRAVAHPVLRHRIVPNFSAEAEGYSTDRIIDELLAAIPANQS